jgi:branched-chain amino acid transport system permease protein
VSIGSRIPVTGLLVIVIAFLPFLLSKGDIHLGFEVFVILALAQMWNLLAGYGGLMSLGLQAFIGLGAYCVFFLSNTLELSPYLVLPAAPLFCAAVAAASAAALFRLREAYFVIASWVFSEIIAIVISKTSWLGGSSGLSLLTTGLIDLRWFQTVVYWLSGFSALAAIAGSYVLLKSPIGLGLMGVRDNDRAATSIGINAWSCRFLVFVVSAAGAGFVGAINYLASLYVTTVGAFDIGWTGAMIFIVVVGGIGTLEGPILGTLIYTMLRELFTLVLPVSGSWYLVTMGAIAAATMVIAPQGLWPFISEKLGIELLPIRREPPSGMPESGGELGITYRNTRA